MQQLQDGQSTGSKGMQNVLQGMLGSDNSHDRPSMGGASTSASDNKDQQLMSPGSSRRGAAQRHQSPQERLGTANPALMRPEVTVQLQHGSWQPQRAALSPARGAIASIRAHQQLQIRRSPARQHLHQQQYDYEPKLITSTPMSGMHLDLDDVEALSQYIQTQQKQLDEQQKQQKQPLAGANASKQLYQRHASPTVPKPVSQTLASASPAAAAAAAQEVLAFAQRSLGLEPDTELFNDNDGLTLGGTFLEATFAAQAPTAGVRGSSSRAEPQQKSLADLERMLQQAVNQISVNADQRVAGGAYVLITISGEGRPSYSCNLLGKGYGLFTIVSNIFSADGHVTHGSHTFKLQTL